MAFTTTSNFAGKAAGFYVSAALKEAKSLEYMTMIENIKYKSNIQRQAGSSVVRDATCDFTDYGTLALTEKVLTPENLQINLDLCKATLLDSWEALQMRAGAGAPPPASFDDYVISYMGNIIAEATENSIWSGAAATNGEFEGFMTATTGIFAVDGTVVASSASGAYTAGNIVANLQTATSDLAANIPGVLRKEDLHIYMSPKSYRVYIQAISALTGTPWGNMNDKYYPIFEGIKIAVCTGMNNDVLVAAERGNLFFGTDLISDAVNINLLDMSQLDGSSNLRAVCRYSGGTQVGIGADVVLVS